MMRFANAIAPEPPSSANEEELGRFFLRELDVNLISAVQCGAIRLLDANVLREDGLQSAASRQKLEARERDSGERLYLDADSAVAAIQTNRRTIGFLSYGWRTRRHPDPDGCTLRAVVEALRYGSCAHITGLFWDYLSLYQAPRTAEQEAMFRLGLQVMGDGYASPMGTTVLQCPLVPPAPADLALSVSIVGVTSATEDAIDELTTAPGTTLYASDVVSASFEEELVLPGATPTRANGCLVLQVANKRALVALQDTVAASQPTWSVFPRYHALRYDHRGWVPQRGPEA